MTKSRFYEICLTALLGALIAFLQSMLVGLSTNNVPTASPEIAATAAGAIRFWYITKIYS